MITKTITNNLLLLSALMLLTACGSGADSASTEDTSADIVETTHTIATINEASGICYSPVNDALFVVSDRGILYKLDTNGTILKEQTYKTSKGKKYDFEGVACDDAHGNLVVAVEGKDNVMTINQTTFEKTPDTGDILRPTNNILYKDKDGKTGIEGISINKDGTVFISNQSNVPYPGQDSSFIFTIDFYTAVQPILQAIFDPKLTDIAGLDFYHDSLYMVHAKNRLSQYDIDTKKVLKTITLPTGVQAEGVAFDKSGNIYFADDEHGKVYKYKVSEIGVE